MIENNNNNNNNNKEFTLSQPFDFYKDTEYGNHDNISFWGDVAKEYIHWDKPFSKIFYQDENEKSEWFKDGLFNICYNALDKHIKNGRGDQVAFVYEIPLESKSYQITYRELFEKVCRLSRSLKNLGVKKGDVVMIYMHNCFEAIISMLACSRIGAIHNFLFGCFLSNYLVETINRCKPVCIIVSNYGYIFEDIVYFYQSLEEALPNVTEKPNNIILFKRNDIVLSEQNKKESNVLDWEELIKNEIEPLLEYELVESKHPHYILFSSGTTNKPKAIVRDSGGSCIGSIYSTRNNFGLKQGDTFFSKSSIGWISGHSTLTYGCLFTGVTSIFLEGSFRDSINEFWNIIGKYQINNITIIPFLVRYLIKYDPNGEIASKYNIESLKKITVCAEKVHTSIIDYLFKIVKRDIICNEYGQTETGGTIIGNPSLQLPYVKDSIGKPTPGYIIKIVSKSKENPSQTIENKPNEIGEIAIKLPLPPFISNRLFDDDQDQSQFKQIYTNEYPGYFRTKDIGYCDEDGYFYYSSRADDAISVGGYILNCAVIENEIFKHPNVIDCSVIGIKEELYNQVPLGFLVLKENIDLNNYQNLKNEINQTITNNLSFGAILSDIIVVKQLPKTKSGKTLKQLLTLIFDGNTNISIPSSLENKNVISELLEEYRNFKKI
ncbi:hypothetical protein DICPUDRAFT_75854 [Dictyostelium purpureum]|uniref:AMP-dependent synthetase/ligase domain-containing protein n=1 Tax=Dictyostelium purpureum TaxID=5786 RepID=F0ZBV3_DICPU|nr:uncharacterized protein DICPUDRAFT_75854 [Dictyostelium purpureum]EGC38550.1 hypothetical protein DICPUDRAFT_75854 [Dictyostelium purpureum]|eukprot:XP_003284921.1 hypothetical protein DICPUDRAFT_75854 [Dictyostelium purpureum]